MILPLSEIVWVRTERGTQEPFDAARLARSIRRQAAAVGFSDWWLAESIAEAVRAHMVDQVDNRTVGEKEIATIVEALLSMMGFEEIAAAYARRKQSAEVRLDEMATAAGVGFELGFYPRLDATLSQAANLEMRVLQLHGLRSCVMQLLGVRRWHNGCRRLAEEIVRYARCRVAGFRPQDAAGVQLAVFE